MSDPGHLSAFTGSHGQHDTKWMFPGARPRTFFCLACAAETFEAPNADVPSLRKKHLLGEILKALGSREKVLAEVLTEENHVAAHLTQTVYGILEASDESLSTVVIEVLVQLCCVLESEELVCYLVHQISVQVQAACSFSVSLPHLTLLGQLLHSIPALQHTVNNDEASLMAHIVTGLAYPDDKVKSPCVFILAQAIPPPTEGSRQVYWWSHLADSVLPLLSAAQSKELKINAMGLLKKLLERKETTRTLMQCREKASLASVLKKMLLSRDSILQVTSVQCTAQVLLHQKAQPASTHCQYAEELLNGDLAEFLYETLATTNGLLLSSVFCCLLLFTEVDSFFSKCHAVYGIESIVRAVQQSVKLNNTEALSHGLQLLSEIFKNQPADIPLMNHEATFAQLCTLLTDCLTHSAIATVIHAAQTLGNLLRWDHLPKPLHYQPLLTVLRALLASLQRLNQDLAPPGSTHSQQRSRGQRHSQARHLGQARQAGQGRPSRPRTTEQEALLSAVLDTVSKAFRVVPACLKDPSSSGSPFAAPSASQTVQEGEGQGCGLESLIQFLLQALDGTCIPLVMTNFDSITCPDIFTSLFGMLCVAMEMGVSNSHQFSTKLASSSFIQLALTVNNRFSAEDSQLQNVISSFLSDLCTSLQGHCPSEEQQQVHDMLQQALPQIHGSANEMLCLLHESPPTSANSLNETGPDSLERSLHLKQQACLTLLYYATLYNDKLAHESATNTAILTYLSNNQPNLKRLPAYTCKHLLLLLAAFHGNRNEQSRHTGVKSFLQALESRDMTNIYTHHACILDWCFGSACQRSTCAQKILEQWLLHSQPDDGGLGGSGSGGDGINTVSKHLQMNPTLFETILDILASGGQQLVKACLTLLESVFSSQACSNPEPRQQILRVLERRLPGIIQSIFISEEQCSSDVHILGFLQLMCAVHKRFPKSLIEAADIKLIYHVSNLLSRTSISQCDILQASLSYLTLLLIQTAPQETTRVVSVLLSKSSTLRLLEGLLSPHQSPCPPVYLQSACLSLLASIITCQDKSNIKVPYTISLDVSSALELIRTNKHVLRKVCGLHLWTALLQTKMESSVLRIVSESPARTLVEDEDVNLHISARVIKTLYVWLQNGIVQGDCLLSQAAVSCMTSLVAYLQDRNALLAAHLLSHSWNQQLITNCLDSSFASGQLPVYLMQLLAMFLGRGIGNSILGVEQLEGVASCLKSMDVSRDSSQPILCHALTLAEQVVTQPHVKLTLQMVADLRAFLQQVATENHYQLPWRQNNVLHIQGVVVQSPRSSSLDPKGVIQADEVKPVAKKLLQKLDTYRD